MVKKHLSRLLSVIVAAALAFASLPLEAVYAAGASDSNGSLTLQDAETAICSRLKAMLRTTKWSLSWSWKENPFWKPNRRM